MFLTNALTGWSRPTGRSKWSLSRNWEEERDRAERVKRETPILVILGNPPYNGFAGMAVDEERELSEAYRTTKRVRRPEGQGLNDLYIRFFRMAERRIAEKTGQGVVCFISNYSWLDGLSFTGMRALPRCVRRGAHRLPERRQVQDRQDRAGRLARSEHLLDRGRSGRHTGGHRHRVAGAQGGARASRCGRVPASLGQSKRTELLETAETEPDSLYGAVEPVLPLGLPFVRTTVSADWFDWPSLPDLFPLSFPGVKTSRDGFLVDTDLDRLRTRIADYFNADLGHDDIARLYPGGMKSTARFDARKVRDALLKRGGPDDDGFIRFAYRPFDNRWLYWEERRRTARSTARRLLAACIRGNVWLSAAQHLRKGADEPQACFTEHLGCLHLIERTALMFPAWLSEHGIGSQG